MNGNCDTSVTRLNGAFEIHLNCKVFRNLSTCRLFSSKTEVIWVHLRIIDSCLFLTKHFHQYFLVFACPSVRHPHIRGRWESKKQCEREGMSCFQTRLAPPRGLGDVRHRLCPKLPLPLNTHTLAQTHQQNSVSLSKRSTHFLVNILQD